MNNPLQLIDNEEDLNGWTKITLTSIMRSSKGISDIAYDVKQSQVGVYSNSVIGVEPVFIMVNEWNIAELCIGLTKAIEMVNKMSEKKFIILTDNFSLHRYVSLICYFYF